MTITEHRIASKRERCGRQLAGSQRIGDDEVFLDNLSLILHLIIIQKEKKTY